VNTVLGETWEERGDSVEAGLLRARLERYPAEVPTGVGALLAAVDVQGDRLEVVVTGYGAAEESWLIAFTQIHGDPAREPVWHELDRFLTQEFAHESGQKLHLDGTVVDSGGAHTEHVYRFARARLGRRVSPSRAEASRAVPSWNDRRGTTATMYRSSCCVSIPGRTLCYRGSASVRPVRVTSTSEWADEEYLAQLTLRRRSAST
jgi:phage terminase large subunit GpA-like protein